MEFCLWLPKNKAVILINNLPLAEIIAISFRLAATSGLQGKLLKLLGKVIHVLTHIHIPFPEKGIVTSDKILLSSFRCVLKTLTVRGAV